jgi:hypothetical protein
MPRPRSAARFVAAHEHFQEAFRTVLGRLLGPTSSMITKSGVRYLRTVRSRWPDGVVFEEVAHEINNRSWLVLTAR